MPVKPLTPTQVTAYLDRINLPKKYYPENKPTIDLAYITALHVHHITSIPYENLSIHYSKEHDVSIEPDYLFDKIVTRGCGRGKLHPTHCTTSFIIRVAQAKQPISSSVQKKSEESKKEAKAHQNTPRQQ